MQTPPVKITTAIIFSSAVLAAQVFILNYDVRI